MTNNFEKLEFEIKLLEEELSAFSLPSVPLNDTNYIDSFLDRKEKQDELERQRKDRENKNQKKIKEYENLIEKQKECLMCAEYKKDFKYYNVLDNKGRSIQFHIQGQRLLIDFSENTIINWCLYIQALPNNNDIFRSVSSYYLEKIGYIQRHESLRIPSEAAARLFQHVAEWSTVITFKEGVDIAFVMTDILSNHSYEDLFLMLLYNY